MGTLARRPRAMILLWIMSVAIVVGLLVFTSAPERRCPLAIHFIGLTNYATHDAAMTYGVFAVTNRGDISLRFRGITESKSSRGWPIYPAGAVLPHYTSQDTRPNEIAAHQSREVRALLPFNGTPVRISLACEEPWTRWESSRWRVSVWFHDHNLPAVGRFISEGKPGHLILSSEIHK